MACSLADLGFYLCFMIARIVNMHFKPECLEEFLDLFQKYSNQISHFPGCRMLNLIQHQEHPGSVSTYSIWESEDDLNNYRNSTLFKTVWPATKVLFQKSASATSHQVLFAEPLFQ